MTEPVVTVRGEASREVDPDLAGLSLTVHASGDLADRVRATLAEGSLRLAAVIAEHTGAVERSSTSGMHLSPVFHRRNPSRVAGYRGSFTASVSVHDFEALSDLVFALASIPDSQLDGPWWSLRPEHEAYRAVRLDAIADARHRAADYAAAVGAEIAGLVEISDLDAAGGPGPQPMMRAAFAAEMAADEPAFEFEPARQTVTGQVTVRFTITEPTSLNAVSDR